MSQLTIAVSEHLVKVAFKGVVDNFKFETSGSKNFGNFTASYSVKAHLNGGTVEMRDDNTIMIKELDIKWDELKLTLGINIPEICVGGFCLIPWFDGCAVYIPKYCAFSSSTDISIDFDLSDLITSELSVAGGPAIRYVVNPERDPSWTNWEAEEQGKPNVYQIFVIPHSIDIDVFDVADMMGDFAEKVNKGIKALLQSWGFPGWAVDAVMAFLGPIPDMLRLLLDIGDDFGEWLKDLIGDQLGFLNALLPALEDYLKVKLHIYEVPDPYRIMEAVVPAAGDSETEPKVAVKLGIRQLDAHINSQEMVLEGSVGG